MGDDMPELTTETMPHGLELRFGPDGSLQGAHVQLRRVTRYGDQVVRDDVETDARPLHLVDPGGGQPHLREVLDGVTHDALVQNDLLRARVAELERQLDEAEALSTDLLARLDAKETEGE